MKQVKIIATADREDLENAINGFLKDNDPSINLVDVRYTSDSGVKEVVIVFDCSIN